MFKSLNLSIYDLSVDTLDVHAVSISELYIVSQCYLQMLCLNEIIYSLEI